MGYYCRLAIEINEPKPDKTDAICDALSEWTEGDKWQNIILPPGRRWLYYCEDQDVSWGTWGDLWDGSGRDEIAKRVFHANEAPCYVRVGVSALEDAPYEESEYDATEEGSEQQ